MTVHPQEVTYLHEMIHAYIEGASLLKIAEGLNTRGIEYMPGVVKWNKSRLMRILDDRRYMGTEVYPAIIDMDTYQTLKQLKCDKNTRKQIGERAFQMNVPVCCAVCGSKMQRRHDERYKCHQRWLCCNSECKKNIHIEDGDLLGEITDLLNQLIIHSDMIQSPIGDIIEFSADAHRLENEIERTLERSDFDKDALREKMLQYVSLKYEQIDSMPYICKQMKADFERSSPLSCFSAPLFDKTVKKVVLHKSGTVSLVLINGQQIGEE